MKILFATIFYPPTHIGGTETYTHALAKGLQQRGHQVQVLCAENWGQGDSDWNGYVDAVHDGVSVRRLCLNWKKAQDVNRSLYDNPVVAKFFEAYAAEWQPDIVHVTSCQTLSASIIGAAKRAGAAVVVTLTDFWFLCPRVTLLRSDGQLCDGQVEAWECVDCLLHETKTDRWSRALLPQPIQRQALAHVTRQAWLTRLPGLRGMALDIQDRRRVLRDALMRADYVIAPSHFVKTYFEQNGFNIAIAVIPWGNDLAWLSDYRGKTASASVRFGYLGQILPIKGIHLIVEAFNSLPRAAQAQLFIHGALDKDPAYTEHLRQLARGNPNVHLAGPFQRSELARVLANLDVEVFASVWHETYGLVVQEALAAQTPVIASNVGAIPEAVKHGVNGLLFKMGDVQDLARQMGRIVEEPELLPRLQAGIQPVKTMERELDEILQVYMNVSKSSARERVFEECASPA